MSIDTATKRRYATSVLPIHKVPIPSGEIGWAERLHAAWIYPIGFPGVYIDSDKIQYRKGSLSIDLRIEERSTAEFTVVDIPGTASYQKGQPVIIYDTAHALAFGGVIDTPERAVMAPSGSLFHPIRCADWHYLADKRLVAESYVVADAITAGGIVEDIYDKYLADEGVTIGNIEVGPIIREAVFNYVKVTDAYDSLAEKAGKIWYIDEYKALYFVNRDITPAPWNATTAEMLKDTARWSGGNPKYRNRQYIRGGKGTTAAQEEKFIGDGEQKAFTVGFPFQKVPTSVTVVIVAVPVAQSIGIKGIDVAKDCYWNKGDATLTFTDAPGDGKEIVVNYFGQFPILVLVEDPLAIAAQLAIEGAGTGYVDDIADEPKLDDKDASFDAAIAKLTRYAVAGQRFEYQTLDTGLRPGQLQTINYATLGLVDTSMLIESVRLRFLVDEIYHDITAITGPTTGSWADLFKALAHMKAEVIERLNVGSVQLLIILARIDENWAWDEDVDLEDIHFACPIPAVTLYPSVTLYPC